MDLWHYLVGAAISLILFVAFTMLYAQARAHRELLRRYYDLEQRERQLWVSYYRTRDTLALVKRRHGNVMTNETHKLIDDALMGELSYARAA